MLYAVLIPCLLAVGGWWYLKLRGLRLARAYTYLMILGRSGSTPESSNRMALAIDMYAANQLKPTTTSHINEAYHGSPPALLAEARSQGFRG